MGFTARLGREARFLAGLVRTLGRVRSIRASSATLICDDLEGAAARWPARTAITFEGHALTYGEVDALANRCAHWALALELARGEVVALVLANRLEYLPIWYGLTKVGVVAALINDELAGDGLLHCLAISRARHVLVDAQTGPRIAALGDRIDPGLRTWRLGTAEGEAGEFDTAVAAQSSARPPRSVRAGVTASDTALLIYTSGTTGLPKAARITHMRAQLYMRGFAGATGARADDRIYVALPLYHATGGLCATGAALLNGGAVVLRRSFSAHHFWADVEAERATMFVYIGELCRYLVNQSPAPQDGRHQLRLAFGNGLRPDVWTSLTTRFAIPRVLEFYGSTEGNVSMFNFDGQVGAIGRLPSYLARWFNIALLRFDIETETPLRGEGGLCIEAAPDEVGECVGRIGVDARSAYAGYADKAASESKVLHDVLSPGDRWFRTGDLMRKDREGYFYFVDRIGDTFRWKGQNVSTTEVAQALLAMPGVSEANVYGVKVGAQEGRAGMAALVVGPNFDLQGFAAGLQTALPPYAQPLFLRLLPRMDTTGTFKHRKADLVADGFDPATAAGRLYFREPGGFVPLNAELHARIVGDEMRF